MTTSSSKNTDFIQVAGHTNYGEHNVPCILISDDGLRVLKLIQQPPRGQKELIFYRQINGGFDKNSVKAKQLCSDSGINSRRFSYKFDSEYAGSESSYNSSMFCWSVNGSTANSIGNIAVNSTTNVSKTANSTCISNSLPQANSSNGIMQTLNESLLSEFKIAEELQLRFLNFVAKFYGVKTVNGYDYLELERIGYRLTNRLPNQLPNQLSTTSTADIKIGRVTYDPLASEAKKKRSNKWDALPHVGYQYLGIKRNNESLIDKSFCRGLKLEEIHKVHEKFLPEDNIIRKKVVGNILVKIDEIIAWFEEQRSLQFYGSSLLIVYDSVSCEVDVKMIDFAHVFYESGKVDENYLFGARKLREAFRRYL